MAEVPLLVYGATGRMGRAVREAVSEFPEIALRACVAPRTGAKGEGTGPMWLAPEDLKKREVRDRFPADLVVLDFSIATGTTRLLSILEEWPRALVAATTGLDESLESRIEALAKRVAVFRAPNLSIGNAIVQSWLRANPSVTRELFSADIVEHHHSGKKDAPSGTALALASILGKRQTAPGRMEAPHIHSIRSGAVPGTHRVLFSGAGETLEIVHTVFDRAVFARGALRAVLFLHGRAPGLYSIDQLVTES
ncbi:MAG: 4-hydroxy-tetrahydrodipicolinate reductase [Candidatus Eiseniibacteriota bacterium]